MGKFVIKKTPTGFNFSLYAANKEKYTKRINQYFRELKGLKTKAGNNWFDTKKLNNAKKYHDEKNKRFLQQKNINFNK